MTSEGGSTVHAVVACVTNGERLEIAAFASVEEARDHVLAVTKQLECDDSSPWPQFGTTFVRPSSIVALQIVEQPRRSWAGSTARSVLAGSAGAASEAA
jgi:hypothetical protein